MSRAEKAKGALPHVKRRTPHSKSASLQHEVTERALKLRRRYREDPEFRERMLASSKRWRERNWHYDQARKTIDSWNLSTEKRQRQQREWHQWKESLSPQEREALRKRINKKSLAWWIAQANTPILGWAFRTMYDHRNATLQEREKARALYKAVMEESKRIKRARQMALHLRECSAKQKRKITAMLKKGWR